MKTSAVVFFLMMAAAAPCDASEIPSPIAKVISMIGDLETKVMKDGEAMQKTYEEYSEFCEERSKELSFEVKTGKANKEELEATIAKASADIDTFTAKIEELANKIATAEADLKSATEIRAKEAADFVEEEKELELTVHELTGGIAAIEKAAASGASMLQLKGAQTFAQVMSRMVDASAFSSADAKHLTALVQSMSESDDADEELAAPSGATYESHSGGIDDLLHSLLTKAEDKLEETRQAEKTAIYNFDMLKVALQDEAKYGALDMDHAKKDLAEATQTKGTAEGDLAVCTKDLAADEASSAEMHADCMTKANDFEVETKARGEELKALATAKKIVVEATSGLSFLQVSEQVSAPASKGFAAVHFVRRLAQKQHSAVLSQLASRMASAVNYRDASGANPFSKIKGLIMGMIEKLEDEAKADAEKKGFCDKEMSETEAKKAEKEAEIEKLSTKIDEMSTSSSKLQEEVAVLQKELAELASAQATMNKLRAEEKEEYDANKAELEQGIAGIQLALKVLRDYYAKGDASASSDAGSGIISMLEVAESDCTKNLQEIESAESTAVTSYDKMTKENDITKTTKSQDAKYKSKEAKGLDESVAESSTDRSSVQTELDAVLEYYAEIKKKCVAKVDSYEQIKARREAEIAGLKEALEILESEAALIQKSTQHTKLRGKHA